MNVTKQKEKGFTIIEVVLVLAIAGLIFLMVFIALPQLQRSQRNPAAFDAADEFAAHSARGAHNRDVLVLHFSSSTSF